MIASLTLGQSDDAIINMGKINNETQQNATYMHNVLGVQLSWNDRMQTPQCE